MKTINIDLLNTVLILISLLLAYYVPFELFIFVYAVLGPLHYFTEINWIRDKKYFVENNKLWMGLVILLASLLSIPLLIALPVFQGIQEYDIIRKIRFTLPLYFNACFFIALISALALVIFKKKQQQYLTIGFGICLAVGLHFVDTYHMLVGILLPTVIHVYLFTLLFMWYGNLKSKNSIGYVNVGLLVMIPFAIAFIEYLEFGYFIEEKVRNIYAENSFHVLNANIAKLIGASDGTTFSFTGIVDIKIQVFIAFAYTYHYLNWFSKTTIIGWHKKLTHKKSLIIAGLWIASVSLYFYNYRIGLSLLLFLSLLHVFMEFPLNIISIRAIGKSLFTK